MEFKNFKEVVTPLICQDECGSVTYGYIKTIFDWKEGRLVRRIECAGCGYIHSKEQTEYLDSIEYAEDFIRTCFDENEFYDNKYSYLNHFVGWLKFEHQKQSLLMRMITDR